MKKVKLLGSILCFFLLFGCSSDNGGGGMSDDNGPDPDPIGEDFQRGPMLINWADNLIIPAYQNFSLTLDALQSAYDAFKSDASESNLTALRQSWQDAYLAWQTVSLFEIGPAEAIGYRLNMNTYPTDFALIEDHVASGSYNLSLSSNRDTKGFPALDYLINGLAESDSDIVAKYAQPASNNPYFNYIDDVLADMTSLTDQVVSEWQQGYRDTFVNNDGSSSTASVDRFVNDYIFYYEKFLRAGKMGIPLGVFTGTKVPGNVEAFHKSDFSNTLFLAGLQAVQDFFNGKHFGSNQTGESLDSYLDTLNTLKDGEDLGQVINDQFNEARGMVEAPDPFLEEIENNNPPTDMLLAYDAVQLVVPLFKVDMVSAMSISIDFVDADGD